MPGCTPPRPLSGQMRDDWSATVAGAGRFKYVASVLSLAMIAMVAYVLSEEKGDVALFGTLGVAVNRPNSASKMKNSSSRSYSRDEISSSDTLCTERGNRASYDFLRSELQNPCQKQGYSQGNQDCQLDAIFYNIGTTNKYYVEYGFNTKKQCSGSGPNTCKLWKEHGWTGLLLDGDNQNDAINLHAHYLYGNNAANVLKKYNVPEELDFLSGDMDSHDYFVMENILTYFRPRVVTTEYNINWPENFTLSQVDPTLAGLPTSSFKFLGCVWGASASALKFLMEQKGYTIIGVTPGLDLIWGRKDVFQCYDIPSFSEYLGLMKLGTPAHFKQRDLSFLDKMVDTVVWDETKDIEKARVSARKQLEMNMRSGALPCLDQVAKLIDNQ